MQDSRATSDMLLILLTDNLGQPKNEALQPEAMLVYISWKCNALRVLVYSKFLCMYTLLWLHRPRHGQRQVPSQMTALPAPTTAHPHSDGRSLKFMEARRSPVVHVFEDVGLMLVVRLCRFNGETTIIGDSERPI